MAIDLSSLIIGNNYLVDDEPTGQPDVAGFPPWTLTQVNGICRGKQVSSVDENLGMATFELPDQRTVTRTFTVIPEAV